MKNNESSHGRPLHVAPQIKPAINHSMGDPFLDGFGNNSTYRKILIQPRKKIHHMLCLNNKHGSRLPGTNKLTN